MKSKSGSTPHPQILKKNPITNPAQTLNFRLSGRNAAMAMNALSKMSKRNKAGAWWNDPAASEVSSPKS